MPTVLGSNPLAFGITQKWLRNFKRNVLAPEFMYLDVDMALKKKGLHMKRVACDPLRAARSAVRRRDRRRLGLAAGTAPAAAQELKVLHVARTAQFESLDPPRQFDSHVASNW